MPRAREFRPNNYYNLNRNTSRLFHLRVFSLYRIERRTCSKSWLPLCHMYRRTIYNIIGTRCNLVHGKVRKRSTAKGLLFINLTRVWQPLVKRTGRKSRAGRFFLKPKFVFLHHCSCCSFLLVAIYFAKSMPRRLFQNTSTFSSLVRRLNYRCFALSLGIVSLTSFALVYYKGLDLRTPNTKLHHQTPVNDVLKMLIQTAANDSAACKLPVLDPFHPSVVNFMKDLGKLSCEGVSYSSFENNVLRIEGEAVVSAQFRKIERAEGDDFRVVLSDPVKVLNTSGDRASATDQKGEIKHKCNLR